MVEFEYWKLVSHVNPVLDVYVYNENGILLFNTAWYVRPPVPTGLLRSWFVVPGDLLNNGTHRIELGIGSGISNVAYHSEDLLVFDVRDAASDLRGMYHGVWDGAIRPHLDWITEQIDPALGQAAVSEGQR